MKNNIYFVADTHFNHKNIIEYCNRPFDDVAQMNEILTQNWNKVVAPDDIVYHLGDVGFDAKEKLIEIVEKLNGKKMLIRGNHDTRSVKTYENMGFIVLKDPPIKLEEYKLFLSHTPRPDNQIPDGYVNVHGHIHNNPLHGGDEDFESYPEDLYSDNRHVCVCVDVTDFRPISIEELQEIIERGR